MSTKSKSNKAWKKKAVALSMAATMTIMGTEVLVGCSPTQQASTQERVKEQEDDDQNTYHGNGGSAFLFSNAGGSSGSTSSNYSSGGWKSWKAPVISSGMSNVKSSAITSAHSYSSAHASSVSS